MRIQNNHGGERYFVRHYLRAIKTGGGCSSHCHRTFTSAVRNSSAPVHLAIDEMMVRCYACSVYTAQILEALIPCGYKILELCDAGYALSWLYASRVNGIAELQPHNDLTSTGSAILQLCNILDPSLRQVVYIYGTMHSQQTPCSGRFGCSASVVFEGVARHVRTLLGFLRGSGATRRPCFERCRLGRSSSD